MDGFKAILPIALVSVGLGVVTLLGAKRWHSGRAKYFDERIRGTLLEHYPFMRYAASPEGLKALKFGGWLLIGIGIALFLIALYQLGRT